MSHYRNSDFFEVELELLLQDPQLRFFEESRNRPGGQHTEEGFEGGVEQFGWEIVVHGFFLLASTKEVKPIGGLSRK
jgi:hypothetical protein